MNRAKSARSATLRTDAIGQGDGTSKASKTPTAICGKPETKTRGQSVRSLAVDHNHATRAVRGLLCGNCNIALGYFDHDPKIVRRAVAYLDRYAPDESD
jgi:hypothetical protein